MKKVKTCILATQCNSMYFIYEREKNKAGKKTTLTGYIMGNVGDQSSYFR